MCSARTLKFLTAWVLPPGVALMTAASAPGEIGFDPSPDSGGSVNTSPKRGRAAVVDVEYHASRLKGLIDITRAGESYSAVAARTAGGWSLPNEESCDGWPDGSAGNSGNGAALVKARFWLRRTALFCLAISPSYLICGKPWRDQRRSGPYIAVQPLL